MDRLPQPHRGEVTFPDVVADSALVFLVLGLVKVRQDWLTRDERANGGTVDKLPHDIWWLFEDEAGVLTSWYMEKGVMGDAAVLSYN